MNDKSQRGTVYLVGAGPGDVGLLTGKGKQLIETADVVVFDRLVSAGILALIPEDTERIDVGKHAGNHPVPQDQINQILLEQALLGKKVVRLKGGDPFLFGRGGEELELLEENNISFEVVPGITSAIAAATYGGIPVTHRDFCSSVHFITGHARAGKELSIDFEALVRLQGTLVFLMSVSTAGRIADGLLQAGMDPEMPSAVIENGTRTNQRTFVQPVSELEKSVKENGVQSPALIVVGKVSSLAKRFSWFDRLPLKGKRFLVTRPEAGESRLAAGLRALGADVTVHPCIRTFFIRPLEIPAADQDGAPFDTIVFTSAVGVRSYLEWLLENGQDMRVFAGKKIACIGSATAKALKEYGLIADFVPSVYSGQVLGEEMISSGFVNAESKVLLLRTNLASHDVTDCLEKAGISYTDIPVYQTDLLTWESEDDEQQYDCITFTSRSCVEGFMNGRNPEDNTGLKALCIGEKTAEAAKEAGFDVVVSEKATIDSMLEKAAVTHGNGGLSWI